MLNVRGFNLGQLRSMLDEIDTMTPEEHQHIIKILIDSNINYTENENGIFAKLNQLSLDDIYSIYNYVDDVRKTKSKLETAIRSIEDSLATMKDSAISVSTTADLDVNENDWKKEAVKKMRTETRSRVKTYNKKINAVEATTNVSNI